MGMHMQRRRRRVQEHRDKREQYTTDTDGAERMHRISMPGSFCGQQETDSRQSAAGPACRSPKQALATLVRRRAAAARGD
jgi:hypothetical protein